MTLTTPAPQGFSVPPQRRLRRQRPRVVAVVVAHDGARWLPRTLAAIAAQSREVDVVVGVDTGSRDGSADQLREHLGASQVVVVGRRTGFGAAVRAGLEHLAPQDATAPTDADETPGADWVWLLHDDSAAEPRALEHLLDAAAASSQVGVVGPKLVSWADPTRLLEAGLTVSRGGRRVTGVADDERDQGQHDHRTDVLAVGTAGMLVDRALWDRLGGLDPALPLLRDDIDLCWRAHLAGRRVVLAPRAVVADAQAATSGLREVDAVRAPLRRVDRRGSLHVALARCSWPALPVLWAWLLVGGVARSFGLLVAKAPRRAADELLVTLAVTATPWTWLGSRWRARGTRRVRRRDVSGLLGPRLAWLHHGAERLGGLAARDAAVDSTPLVGTETGPVADEADPVRLAPVRWPRRVLRHPMTTVLVAVTALTALLARRVGGGSGALAGGQLLAPTGRPGDLWHAAVDGWAGPGLGGTSAASPAAVVRAAVVAALAPVAGDAAGARAIDLLLLGGPVLAAVSAYVATGSVARSRWARGWAALVWGVWPVVTGAVGGGRLGPVAAAVLLPVVAAATARSLARRRTGAWRAVCVAALAGALLAVAVPALLVVLTLVAVGGLLLARGARLRALALLVLTPALLGPWLTTLAADPRRLLAGPGTLVAGRSQGALRDLAAALPLPVGWPAWVALAILAPVLVVGLAGLLRPGARGRALAGLWLVGLLGLAAALAAPHVVLTTTQRGPLHPDAGTGVALLLLAAVTAAIAGADGLRRRIAVHGFGWRQLVVAPLVLAAVLAPLAAAATWVLPGATPATALQRSSQTLPAVAVDAARGPAALRTLVVGGTTSGVVTAELDGAEPGPWARDLAVAADDRPVTAAVAALVGETPSADQVRTLAVGFVVVSPSAPPRVTAALVTLAGLTRLGSTRGSSLWRVNEPLARVSIEAAGGSTPVPVDGAHAAVDTTVSPAGGAPRRLLLAEPASSRWRAELDGRLLPAVADPQAPWRQAFALPAAGGHLVVRAVDPLRHAWLLGQGALALVLLVLALPGVRRQTAGPRRAGSRP